MKRSVIAAMVLSAVLAGGCPPTENGNTGGNQNVDGNGSASGAVRLGEEVAVANEGEQHLPTGVQATYASNPPASGPHWPTQPRRGFFETAVEEEEWVHGLEHGYVVVLYDCDGECDEGLLAELERFARNAPASAIWDYPKIIVTPYDGLPEPAKITAVAWDVQIHFDAFDESSLLAFFERYQDQGPEDAP